MTSQDKKQKPLETSASLSDNPQKAMQEMMDRIDDLHNIYIKENEALAHADTQSFMALQNIKVLAAKNYQTGMSQLMENKEELEDLPHGLKDSFKERQQNFSKIAEKNIWHLNRLQGGVKRLHERLMYAARENAEKDGVNYSAHGQINNQTRGLSMGLNESA